MFRSKNFLLTMHRFIKLKVTRNYAREYYSPQQIIQPELLFMNKTNSDILKLKKQIYNLEKARQALQEQISETTSLVRELSNVLAASKEEEDTTAVLSQAASDIEEQSPLESNKHETTFENESEYEQSTSVLHETPTVEYAEPKIDKPSGAAVPKYKEPERVEQLNPDMWYPYLKPDDVQLNAEHNITMKLKETPEFDKYTQHKAAAIAFVAPSLDPIEPTSINADTQVSNQQRPLAELYTQETVDYATDSENIAKQGYLSDQEALATSTIQLSYITEPEFNTWSNEQGYKSELETISIATEKFSERKGFESELETKSIATEDLNETKGLESKPETINIVNEGLNKSKSFESEPETMSIAPEGIKEIEQISIVKVQSDITWSEQEPHITQEDIVNKELEDISEINQIEIQRLEESIKKQPEAIKLVDLHLNEPIEAPTTSDATAKNTHQEASFTMETQTLKGNILAQETAPTLHHEQDIISENQAETSATLIVTPIEESFPKTTTYFEISSSTDETNATLIVTPIEGSFPKSVTNSEISPSTKETLMVTPIEGSFPKSTTHSEISPSTEETRMITPIEESFPKSTPYSDISPSTGETNATLMVTPIEGSFPKSTTYSHFSSSTVAAEETELIQCTEESNIVSGSSINNDDSNAPTYFTSQVHAFKEQEKAEKESEALIEQTEINFQQLQQETVASEKEKRIYQRGNKKGSSDGVDAGEFVDY